MGDTESSVSFDGKKISIPGLADIDTAANSHSAFDLLRVWDYAGVITDVAWRAWTAYRS